MEIGSFIELEFPKGKEYYSRSKGIARLNTGRAAIWHALRILNASTVWLPYYQCDTVREFLLWKGISIKYYHIDNDFNPTDLKTDKNDAVMFVNYYGIMSRNRLISLASNYKKVIIDNCQGFFCKPINDCMNVYSARKFVGVPDGAYVLGKDAEKYVNDYPQCYSSDTAEFLLKRIEYGCEGVGYKARNINEHRIDAEDTMKMSKLSWSILDGSDYAYIIQKRKENFAIADSLFAGINKINPLKYFDNTCVPMVYPLVIENDNLLKNLQRQKHFQGHWWSYLLEEMEPKDYEYWISRYIIPITIDQRYGEKEIKHLSNFILI
jgi:hypothetical protein